MTGQPGRLLQVSVLMSCYNGARWLEQAIRSVLAQSFSTFEFIVVDDGSTDGSPEIIRLHAEIDPRIVVVTKGNTGLTDSLNAGLRASRGEWIARLDADDVCEPTRLQKQVQAAARDPGLVFVGSGHHVIDEAGHPGRRYTYPRSHRALVRHLRAAGRFPAHSSALFRADAALSIGGYRVCLKRAQDWDLWLRLSEVGRLTTVKEPLVRVRSHADQISHDESGRRQKVDGRMAIMSYWLRRFGTVDPLAGDPPIQEEFRAWVEAGLERRGQFEVFGYAARLKSSIAAARAGTDASWAAARCVLQEPRLFLRWMGMRLRGERDSRALASAWMNAQGAAGSRRAALEPHAPSNDR